MTTTSKRIDLATGRVYTTIVLDHPVTRRTLRAEQWELVKDRLTHAAAGLLCRYADGAMLWATLLIGVAGGFLLGIVVGRGGL